MFFKTCNDQKDVCLVFTEIPVRTYLNLTKNIYEIFIKKYKHLYCLDFFNGECFSHVYRLMRKFLRHTNPDIYFYIYQIFAPNKNYNSNCFKIYICHNLNYIEEKEKLKQKSIKS